MLVLLFHLLLAVLGAQTQLKTLMHFGNCNTSEYGRGTCIEKSDCEFYAVDKLTEFASKRQCFSRQRPDLVCCPRETNIIPILGARIFNETSNSGNETSTTPLATPTPRTLLKLLKLLPRTTPLPPTGADTLPQHPYCGTSFASRVTGGNDTELYEFPWTTLLEYTLPGGVKDFSCGAAFIAQRWLVTAAHCVHSRYTGLKNLTAARLGEWNKETDPDCVTHLSGKRECAPPHIRVPIDRILPHADFSTDTLTNDIALLRLSQPVDWVHTRPVEPVCLPPSQSQGPPVGAAADVSGWGKTETSESSKIKRKAMLHIQAGEQCREAFLKDGYLVGDSQLCAGGALGVDSCSGDSGGPLTVEADTPGGHRFVYLAGVVSFGRSSCGKSEFSGVYTRVNKYVSWIRNTINENRG
ncbi:serine protease easter [Drosophila bipectinata]|uniref:serine protease easter n=1 Tax=Drosophila bipectinata TaxID=42026 RepID=UPI0038B40658